MVPLSIASAMSIKVGYSNGENNFKDIVRYTACGMMIIFLFTLLMFVMYLKFPVQLIKIFTNDPNVVLIGLPVIFVVVCFLFFDNIQCAIFGALKGLKKTKENNVHVNVRILCFLYPYRLHFGV
jgi:MATE family multidrug resistance protein